MVLRKKHYSQASRILVALAGWSLLWLPCASATPIHPTAKQILNDAQKPDFVYIPARAGWNGPETQTSSAANPLLERFGPAAQQAATRESLLALATPDLRLWAALAIMIFGLRWLVSKAQKNTPGPVLVEQPRTEQPPSHLRAA